MKVQASPGMKASFFLLNEGADVEPDVLGRISGH
jgi:hypothetical protein